MNRELLLDAVGHLDVGLIEKCLAYEAALPCKAKRNWGSILRRVAAVAACLCIAFIGALHMQKILSPQGIDGKLNLQAYIYEGRVYALHMTYDGEKDFVGKELGMVKRYFGDFEDGGLNFSSKERMAHEVEGYSSEFLICLCVEERTEVYLCVSDTALKSGKDLFDDRMHLAENIKNVYYVESYPLNLESFELGYAEKQLTFLTAIPTESMPTVKEFLNALCERDFSTTGEIKNKFKGGYILAFEMQNGLIFNIYLDYEKFASVYFDFFVGEWHSSGPVACVSIEEELYLKLTSLLES